MTLTLIDMILETSREYFIGVSQTENLHMVGPDEGSAINHTDDSSRSSHGDMNALLKFGHILTIIGSFNAGMALNVHVIA